uniref:DUF148 domain-containing protein n=1 Tax=Strongyloides venezuelensis TaxID=75913 RepID=A0A0K0FE42_STRVS
MPRLLLVLLYAVSFLAFIFGQYMPYLQVPRYASRRMRNNFIDRQQFFTSSPIAFSMNSNAMNPSFQSNSISQDFQTVNQDSSMKEQNYVENYYNSFNGNMGFTSQSPYQREILPGVKGYQNLRGDVEAFNRRMIDKPIVIDKNENLDILLPKFLDNVDQEVVNNFLTIISLNNETYAKKQQKLDELISTLDVPHQELYREYVLKKNGEEKMYRSKVDQEVENMSQEAQMKFTQITTILTDPQTPDNEKWNRVIEIYNSLSPQLKEEFEKKFEGFKA